MIFFLPGRWQNSNEFGLWDRARDPRTALRDQGFHVATVAYEAIGQQANPLELATLKLRQFEDDVSRARSQVAPSDFEILIGYSFGASLAMLSAVAKRPSGLILIDGGLIDSDRPGRTTSGESPAELVRSPASAPRFKAALKGYLAGDLPEPLGPDLQRLDRTEAHYFLNCTYEYFPSFVLAEINERSSMSREEIRFLESIPILIVASDSSGSSGQRAIATARSYSWQDCTSIITPGASHAQMICGKQMKPVWPKVGRWIRGIQERYHDGDHDGGRS